MTYLTADATNLDVTERQSVSLISKWIAKAGFDAGVLPCDRETAAAILAIGGEYRVDADELDRLAKLGMVPDVQHYDAKDLICIAGALEGRRAWEYPSVHSPKLHTTARLLEEARAQGPESVAAVRAQLRQTDLAFLLILSAECDNREMREQLYSTIRLVLETDHGVVV